MCAEEKLRLRSVFYEEEILSIAQAQEPSSELHHDLETIYHYGDMTADEIVEAENNSILTSNSAEIVYSPHRGPIRRVTMYSLPSDYEDIFLTIKRRTDRPLIPFIQCIPKWLVTYMHEYFVNSFERCRAIRVGRRVLPLPDLKPFKPLFAYLPECLDPSSWIGEVLIDVLLDEVTNIFGYGYDVGYYKETLSASEGIRIAPRNGKSWTTSKYVTLAEEPGRLVCFQYRADAIPMDDRRTAECKAILLTAEHILILLSFMIANRTTRRVVEEYAIPGWIRDERPLLNRKEVCQAVREILGEKFFHLPFDFKNHDLKKWSEDYILKADDQITEEDPYKAVIGGSRVDQWTDPTI